MAIRTLEEILEDLRSRVGLLERRRQDVRRLAAGFADQSRRSAEWGGKSGPFAYVSPYISNWSRGVDSGGSIDAHSNSYGIMIQEDGVYDISAFHRGASPADYAALALGGQREAFENRSNPTDGSPMVGVWTHDHAAGANNGSVSHYLGQMYAGDFVTAGAYTGGTGIQQTSAASTGAIMVRRIS